MHSPSSTTCATRRRSTRSTARASAVTTRSLVPSLSKSSLSITTTTLDAVLSARSSSPRRSLARSAIRHAFQCVCTTTNNTNNPPPPAPPPAAVAPLRLPFCFSLALSSSPNRCDISSPYLRLATRLPSHPRPPPVKLHHWQANTNRPQSISSYARVCAGWHTNHSLVLLPQPGAASASLLVAPSCSRRCCSRPRPSSPPLPLGPCRCCRSLHRRRCGLRCRLADPARARSVGPCLARATQHSNTTIIMATRVKKIMTQPIVRAAPLAARFAPSLTSWLTLNLVCLVVPRT